MSSETELKELLSECTSSGIHLWADGDQVRLRAPKGSVSPALLDRIRQSKPGLLTLLPRQAPAGSVPAPEAAIPVCGLDRAPLSLAQRRIWFLEQLEKGTAVFNMPLALDLEGPLDPHALEAALAEVLTRQTALRTVIVERDGEPVQEVRPLPVPLLPRLDLSEEAEPAAAFLRTAENLARQPFDLAQDLPCRALLGRLGPDRHGLLLVIHHIASDHWSMGLLLDQLQAAYGRHLQAGPEPLPDVLRTTDFAAWQRGQLSTGRTLEALAACAEVLAGAPPLLTLPWDHPRPAVQTSRGGSLGFAVPPALAAGVAALGRGCGATPFMTWLALWGLLLARLSGQEDVTVGCPVAQRPAGTEATVGMFLSTAVMRLSLGDNPSLATYLERTRAMTLRVLAHQEAPFEGLVERLVPERKLDHTPLFQAMFVLHHSSRPQLALPGLRVTALALEAGVSEFDLNLSLEPTADGAMQGFVEFSTDLFEAATVQRWLGHLLTLCAGAVAQPQAAVLDLPLLSPAETTRLTGLWAGAEVPAPAPALAIPSALLQACQRWPERIAVADAGGSTSYAGLEAWSRSIAAGLGEVGVQPGDAVGILLPRGRAWIASLWGAWLAGATLVSLDPALPPKRLAAIARQAGLKVFIAQPLLAQAAPGWRILDPDACTGGPARAGTADPNPAADATAYVVFTSGSTGLPKGIRIAHGALAFHASSVAELFALAPGEPVLQFASQGFDVCMEEIWPTLLRGGQVVICPDQAREALADFTALLHTERIAVANLPARFWEAWTCYLTEQGEAVPASLRLLVTGSEAVNARALAQWRQLPGGDRGFLSGYGPSEATVTATFFDPARDWTPAEGPLPLGRPLPGVRAYVLDRRLRPVAPGAVGDLFLAGPGLAQGYLEDNPEAFPEDPFVPGERMYRTGDRARLLPAGEGPALLRFEGRADLQVKRRGYRIEPGEIEAALMAEPSVAQALVLPLADGRLGALVAAVPGHRAAPEALRLALEQALAATLPAYMLPDQIQIMTHLPSLPGGKLDRSAAAALLAAKPEPAPAGEAPHPGPEAVLAAIWAQVLAVPRVHREDNFFRLGGDSILALRVVALAARQGLALAPRDVFQGRTLAALAVLARRDERPRETPEEQLGELPATPILAWFLKQGADFQNRLSMSLPLRRTVSEADLRRAVSTLLARHPSLRLRLDGQRLAIAPFDAADADAAVQVVAPEALPGAAMAPFDLARGPLFRATLALPDRLLLQAHHLVVDAVSWGVLLEDLDAALRGEEPPMATTPFPAWARLLQRQAGSWPGATGHWRRLAEGVTALALPATGVPSAPCYEEVQLDAALTARLLRPGQANAPRPAELILAACGLALQRLEGAPGARPAWLLDIEGHGRDGLALADLSRTVGWFTTVTPGRFELAADTARDALLAAKQALRSAQSHALEFGILGQLHPDPETRATLAALPPADLLFNYLGDLDRALAGGFTADSALEALLPPQPLSHPLEINAMVLAGRAVLRLGIAAERWPAGFAVALRRALPECLAEVAAQADIPLAPVPAEFPLAEATGLSAAALAGLDLPGPIEDLYPLSPLQRGMLFHTILDARSGEYFDQFTCQIQGGPDFSPERFGAAWNRALARHPALRSAFFWDGPPEPLQAVLQEAVVPLEVQDWRAFSAAEQAQRMLQLQAQDRELPFDLTRPPLIRLALRRLTEDRWTLLWSNHHLVLDGWSLPLLLAEVCRHYDGLALAADALPGPAYRDFIAWLARQDRDAALAFWRQDLEGFAAPTPLPLAAPEPEPAPGWPQEALELEAADCQAMETALRAQGLTLSALVQGAWGLLLSRYGGGRDVLFGATVSGRPGDLPGADELIGSCINSLPVRLAIPDATAAGVWLAELRDRQALRQDHGHLDLTELTRLASLPPGTALFDSLVLVQNYPTGDLQASAAGGLRLSEFAALERTTFGLTLVVAPIGATLALSLVYDPKRFNRTRVLRLLSHVRALMLRLAQNATAPLDAIELLTEEEARLVHEVWNGTARSFPYHGPWHGLFEAHAARDPEADAVIHGERVLSYGELERRANQLAHRLQAQGVGAEAFVGVWLDRSPEMIVAILGILKAGGAYVPLDPDYPSDRLTHMIEDTRPVVLVTQAHLLDRMPVTWSGATVCLDRDAAALASLPESAPRCGAGPENVAFVIYTSGSTGRPKGTLTLHGSLANLAQVVTEHFQVTPRSRVLQFFSLSFDAMSWEVLMAMGSGAALVLGSPRELLPGQPLFDFLGRHRVTHMTLTPSALAVVPAPADGELPDLRVLITGGEGCDHLLAAKWATGRRYYHGYGPTETTICCSAPHCQDFSQRLSLGHALANMTMYVLDERLRPCPVGVTGEICIGGAGVTRGYLNQPELTDEKFLPDPFSARAGARIYKSGDLGRYRSDGSIEFQSRSDHQLKIRGYRVELGEIQAALSRHPSVSQALVLADRDAADTPRLLAYVVGPEADAATLMAHLKGRLPSYMVPAHLMVLEAFPLTVNNKVDREALPKPAQARQQDLGRILPGTPLEGRIAAVWCELLALPEVGVEENFFDLGGHSLLVMRTCSALNQALGTDLTVMDLFDLPTIRQLAGRLGDAVPDRALREDPADQARRREEGRNKLSTLRERRKGRA